jgi:hypothetical protein
MIELINKLKIHDDPGYHPTKSGMIEIAAVVQ